MKKILFQKNLKNYYEIYRNFMKHKNNIDRFFSFFDKYPREYFVLGFFVVFAFINISVIFSHTVIHHKFYQDIAFNQQVGKVSVPITRGTIYSATNSGTVFGTSVNLYDIAVDPQMPWDKWKLAIYLRDIVYKQTCYLQSKNYCYESILKFLRLPEIVDFSSDKTFVKELILKKIQEKLAKTKVTSVLIADGVDNEKIISLSNLNINWVYPNGNSLYVNPEEITDETYVTTKLSNILWIEQTTIKDLITKRELRYIPIITRSSISLSDEVKNFINEENEAIKKWVLDEDKSIGWFIILDAHPSRFYPEKQVASQIIGFVDSEWAWHYGLEGYFDELLRGKREDRMTKKDIMGRIIDPINLDENDLNGEWVNIYTTIDRNIQSKVEQILEDGVKKYRANKGTIIVMEPNTWEVLAMANYPTFDPNNSGDVYELEKVSYGKYPNPATDLLGKVVLVEDKERGEEFLYEWKKLYLRLAEREELGNSALVKYKYKNDFWAQAYRNDAVSWLYEPWSIMKAVTVSAGIDTWEIKRYDMYNDTGELKIDTFTIKNVSKECIWYKSFNNALNFSCNVWMIRISQKLGKALFYQYLTDFWFWRASWITLDGEVFYPLQPYQKWSIAQLFTSSYGLWISVTPLQMASAYSVIANGGYYVKPRIVKDIVSPNGNTINYKKEVVTKVIKESTSKIVTDMLVEGVQKWVAKSGWVPWYTLAWKTWTSQIAYKWWYETWVGSTIASYAWFWPAEEPKFVIIVKLERSRVDAWWGTTASKMFAELAKYLFDYYGIPSKLSKEKS